MIIKYRIAPNDQYANCSIVIGADGKTYSNGQPAVKYRDQDIAWLQDIKKYTAKFQNDFFNSQEADNGGWAKISADYDFAGFQVISSETKGSCTDQKSNVSTTYGKYGWARILLRDKKTGQLVAPQAWVSQGFWFSGPAVCARFCAYFCANYASENGVFRRALLAALAPCVKTN
jgi:hypothetical protein